MLFLFGLKLNGQVNNIVFLEKNTIYSKLNNKEKQELIIGFSEKYGKSLNQDTAYRKVIVDFFIDTIIANDRVNSALGGKLLLQTVHLNEVSFNQKKKILALYDNGFFNLEITQLIGLLGDRMFDNVLNKIYKNNSLKLKEYEKNILLYTLVRIGDENALKCVLDSLKSGYSQNEKILNQEFAEYLKSMCFISKKEVYNLFFEFIKNDNGKTIIIGSYGGDPYGADDNIYCTLSSFVIEILSNVLVDFPLNRVVCGKETDYEKLETVKKWYENNSNFKYRYWHPYYGVNYNYWPSR